MMVASRAFALDVTQPGAVSLNQDWQALSQAVTAFTVHAAAELGFSSGGLLQWLAVIAAMWVYENAPTRQSPRTLIPGTKRPEGPKLNPGDRWGFIGGVALQLFYRSICLQGSV